MEVGLEQLGKSLLMLNSRFAVVSNNIANSVTDRYKNDTLTVKSFSDFFVQEQYNSNKENLFNLNIHTNFSQGELYKTKKNDIALSETGFIRVINNEEVCYSRGGSFNVNAQGYLVDQHGSPILGTNGRISVNGAEIEIASNGSVIADGIYLDTMEVVDFVDYSNLSKIGKDYYKADQYATITDSEAEIKQGYSEKSNVSVTNEYLKMMELSKSFETGQAVIQILDELNGRIINSIAVF